MAAARSGDRRGDPQVLSWHLEPSAVAVGRMRNDLAMVLDQHGLPENAREAVLLVANELVANAVEHAGSPVQVVVAVLPGTVRIEVRDGSPGAPRLQPINPYAARGRGLQMVDGLASSWSWSADGAGKTVWAEVPAD